jgi:hypothetical protein
MAGVDDYDWSKWPSGSFPLTEDLKVKAAAIADKFTSAADADKYMAESSDPLALKVAVQYAATAKKAPTFKPTFTSSASQSAAVTTMYDVPASTTPPPPPAEKEKSETPWLLIAGGAALLFLLMRK